MFPVLLYKSTLAAMEFVKYFRKKGSVFGCPFQNQKKNHHGKFIRKNVFSLSFFTCIDLALFRDYINSFSVVISFWSGHINFPEGEGELIVTFITARVRKVSWFWHPFFALRIHCSTWPCIIYSVTWPKDSTRRGAIRWAPSRDT